jgi:hypothetical protein
MKKSAFFFLLMASVAAGAGAGTYHLSDTTFYEPFVVVHPAAYDGSSGGPIEIKVCVPPGVDEITKPALEAAIDIWNGLIATTENCTGCRAIEQGPADTGEPYSMVSILLHELGHCGAGIGHINWEDPSGDTTSFTSTKEATSIAVGVDMIRGTGDDRPAPLPGSRVLHWFRSTDNDPFVNSGVVDISTYSRRIIDLPGGHVWPASGNLGVGLTLGHLNTQAIMYSHIDEGTTYASLAADEINTVQFGMSGMDEMAGTSDDYTVSFVITDCASADIEVTYTDLDGDSGLGVCLADIEPLPTGGLEVHHALKPFDTNLRAVIEVNNTKRYYVVFANGFESGNTSAWSATGSSFTGWPAKRYPEEGRPRRGL